MRATAYPSAIATVIFFPEGAFGPTNNCVGIGDVLKRRGHRVVFVVEESFAGTLEAKGFEERMMRLAPPPEEPEEPGQFWKDFVRDTAPVFRGSTLEQLRGFIAPTWRALLDGAIYVAQVHPSAFNDSFLITWLLRIWGFIVEHVIGFVLLIAAGIGFGIRAIIRRIVRWRRRARNRAPAAPG